MSPMLRPPRRSCQMTTILASSPSTAHCHQFGTDSYQRRAELWRQLQCWKYRRTSHETCLVRYLSIHRSGQVAVEMSNGILFLCTERLHHSLRHQYMEYRKLDGNTLQSLVQGRCNQWELHQNQSPSPLSHHTENFRKRQGRPRSTSLAAEQGPMGHMTEHLQHNEIVMLSMRMCS